MDYQDVSSIQSVRLTDAERLIVTAIHEVNPHLTRNARGQNVSGAISAALYDWQDRNAPDLLAPQEESMDEYISIQVTGEELFGNWQDTELYDEDQSVLEYTEQLCAALAEVFRCSIEVVPGDVGKVELGIDNSDDRPRVHQIIGQVYESYAWVRYTRAGVADSLDTGFWLTREDGVTVSVGEIDDGEAYLMSWHKGEMPAHEQARFDVVEVLLYSMQQIADFEHWAPVTE